MALKLVLSLWMLRCLGDVPDLCGDLLPLKSFWTFGHSPPASRRSTRVTWKVGTREASTTICSTLHSESWSPRSIHRSISAPLSPQGSHEDRWSSSWLILYWRQSGRSSLEQPRLWDAFLRLSVMVSVISAARVSSRGSEKMLLSNSDRDVSAGDPERTKDNVSLLGVKTACKQNNTDALFASHPSQRRLFKSNKKSVTTHQSHSCSSDLLRPSDWSFSVQLAWAAGCPRTVSSSSCPLLETEESCRPGIDCEKKTSSPTVKYYGCMKEWYKKNEISAEVRPLCQPPKARPAGKLPSQAGQSFKYLKQRAPPIRFINQWALSTRPQRFTLPGNIFGLWWSRGNPTPISFRVLEFSTNFDNLE